MSPDSVVDSIPHELRAFRNHTRHGMEASRDEVTRLQNCINDLTPVPALAGVWSGRGRAGREDALNGRPF
jgi:hypothetical protein